MAYVSFVEIFQKSVLSFTESGELSVVDGADAVYALATFTFLAGFAIMAAINAFVAAIGWGLARCGLTTVEHTHDVADALGNRTCEDSDCSGHGLAVNTESVASVVVEDEGVDRDAPIAAADASSGCCARCCSGFCELLGFGGEETSKEGGKLMLSGVMTAFAIGIHNFPEGLATFVGALDDPSVGAALAFAIAIHNVPEGICVAFPVFYATAKPGSSACCSVAKWRGFLWAVFSGLSEPIGAAIGYLVLLSFLSDVAYAVVFGLVGGMMIFIVVRELLPTAHKYDPKDQVVTLGFFCGCLVMASSLVGFAATALPSVVALCVVALVAAVLITVVVVAVAYVTDNDARRSKFESLFSRRKGAPSSAATATAATTTAAACAHDHDHAHDHGSGEDAPVDAVAPPSECEGDAASAVLPRSD
jgi:zinc transporter ZupT